MTPKVLLHLEGGAILVVATLFYFVSGGAWQLYLLLLFAPDIAMLGYLAGSRVGSYVYNLVHTTVLPLALLATALLWAREPLLLVALIWLAHIGLDRLLGFGLKYPSAFKHTHLSRV